MHQRMRLFAVIVAGVFFSAAFAIATPITNPYSGSSSATFTSWESALSGSPTTLNFSSLTGSETSPDTLGGFTFSGFTKVADQEFEGSSITVTAPSGGETAMFLYINDQSLNGDQASSFTLTLSDGESSTVNLASCSSGLCSYYGFTDTTPITSLTLTASSSTLSIGGFWYGAAAGGTGNNGGGNGNNNNNNDPPAAEGATMILTSGGLLLLFGVGQRLGFKRCV